MTSDVARHGGTIDLMARRRRSRVITRKSGTDSIVLVEPPRTPAAPRPRKRTRSRRRGRSRGRQAIIGTAIGGAVYGFLEKTVPGIPSLPIIGKSGTVALVCYMLGEKHPIINDVGIAAAAIAGYSLGKTGVISGDYDGPEVV